MALKIRLRQQGRKNRETYRLVVTDSRSPRDGKYVEMLGWYNPFETKEDLTLFMKPDRIQHWLDQGAQMTDKAKALVAKQAPAIVLQHSQKELARRTKATAKRKARKKAAA
jgi:small subunit ribosomal protein S16